MYDNSPPIHVLLLASGLNPSAHSQDCFRQTYALARQSLEVRHRPFSSGKLIFRYVFISIYSHYIFVYYTYTVLVEVRKNTQYVYAHNKHAPHTLANTLYIVLCMDIHYDIWYEIDLLLWRYGGFCVNILCRFAHWILDADCWCCGKFLFIQIYMCSAAENVVGTFL